MEITENSSSRSISSSDHHLGIASFAVYLKPGDDSFVKKLMEEDSEEEAAAAAVAYSSPYSSKAVPKLLDGEIGVFGAEKYFNMSLDNIGDSRRQQLAEAVDGRNKNKKENPAAAAAAAAAPPKVMRRGTPSVRSQSSWTSTTQSSSSTNFLLKRNKSSVSSRGFFAGGLSCYKSCNDTKSIYKVGLAPQQVLSDKSSRGTGSSKRIMEQQFTFPVMMTSSTPILDESRPSLEVFGSKLPKAAAAAAAAAASAGQKKKKKMMNDIVAVNLERKLSVLTWDAIPRTTSSSSVIIPDEQDMTSEASSDLFEIDTISGAGSIAPSSMYPPSEASIEWSVVTASAADFSDYDIHPPFNLIHSSASAPRNPHKSNLIREAPKGRRRQTGFLGCNNLKAVQVAQTTTKTNSAAAAVSSPQFNKLQVIGLTNKK